MKFLCEKTFPDSKGVFYQADEAYEIPEEVALRLASYHSRDGDFGAMSRFKPIDEEARIFMNKLGKTQSRGSKEASTDDEEPKLDRGDLMKLASALGLKDFKDMKNPELIAAIKEAKATLETPKTDGAAPSATQ